MRQSTGEASHCPRQHSFYPPFTETSITNNRFCGRYIRFSTLFLTLAVLAFLSECGLCRLGNQNWHSPSTTISGKWAALISRLFGMCRSTSTKDSDDQMLFRKRSTRSRCKSRCRRTTSGKGFFHHSADATSLMHFRKTGQAFFVGSGGNFYTDQSLSLGKATSLFLEQTQQ